MTQLILTIALAALLYSPLAGTTGGVPSGVDSPSDQSHRTARPHLSLVIATHDGIHTAASRGGSGGEAGPGGDGGIPIDAMFPRLTASKPRIRR